MKDINHTHLLLFGNKIKFPLISHMGTNSYTHAVELGFHCHDGYEFVFVIKGELSYETEDGKAFTIRGGEYSFMPPNIKHQPVGGYETPCLSCWIIFNPKVDSKTFDCPFSQEDLDNNQKNLICSKRNQN